MKKAGKWIGVTLLCGGTFLYLIPLFFPLPEDLDNPPEQGAVLTDRNGTPLRRFLTEDGLRIDAFATLEEIPEHLLQATIAVEDQRFYRHLGVDYIGTCRALRDSIKNRRMVSGASTITQQLVKICSPQRSRSLATKVIEINSARKLEFFTSKEKILTAYLNRLPYGNQLTGCRSAARRYFGKPLSDLSIAEAAFLAGLPNRPSYLNPYRNFKAAQKRQHFVLKRMLEEGFISANQYSVAIHSGLALNTDHSGEFEAPHFVELFLRQHDKTSKQVVTTLDLPLQQLVERAATSRLEKIESGETIHAAVIVIDNPTGEVLALTGSRDFFNSEAGQINGAWEPRSAGSTLKPFTYLMALEKGYTAASILADIPVEYVSAAGAFQPVNFDRTFQGPVTFRRALATSLNVPAVRLLQKVGGPRALHSLLQDDFAFSSLQENGDIYGLGLTIGNAEVRLLELTNAYACLARLGKWKPCTFIQQGTVPDRTLFSRENSWILADILSDNDARAPAFGVQSPLRLPFRVAAKTGTSTDFRDCWTLGFTPDYTVGVWMGKFDNDPLPEGLTGALGAGPIFHEVMSYLYQEQEPSWYPKPDGIQKHKIDQINGLLVSDDLPAKPKRMIEEYFVGSQLPASAKPENYTSDGKTLLQPDYAIWWDTPLNPIKNVAFVKPSENDHRFEVLSPKDGTVAYLDPDLPAGGQRFPLRFAGAHGSDIQWVSESLQIEKRGNAHFLLLEPGTHFVEAIHTASGETKKCRITVESL